MKLSRIVDPSTRVAWDLWEIAQWLWLFHVGYAALWDEGVTPALSRGATNNEEN